MEITVYTLTTVNEEGNVSVDVQSTRDGLVDSFHAALGGWVDAVEDVTDLDELYVLAQNSDMHPEISEHTLVVEEN